jgi:hypothetical protein
MKASFPYLNGHILGCSNKMNGMQATVKKKKGEGGTLPHAISV